MYLNKQKTLSIEYQGRDLFVSKEYEISGSDIWNIITDTAAWPEWGPSLKKVECNERFIQAGSRGRVQTIFGVWLQFTITKYEAMSYWDWRIGRVQATGHQVTSLQPTRCRLAFTMPWWATPYCIVCIIALLRIQKIVSQQK